MSICKLWLLIVCGLLATATQVSAAPISILIGDNDGFGIGVPDNGNPPWTIPPLDNRSVAEAAATNGAQITDVYSSLFPGAGPNAFSTANVIFPFLGTLTSGTLTIDMGDFQASSFGPFLVSFNGVNQPGLFTFEDGFQRSVVRSFVLDSTALANANAAGQLVVTIDRNGSGDYVSFDYFRLDAVAEVPEPASIALWSLISVSGTAAWRRRKRAVTI